MALGAAISLHASVAVGQSGSSGEGALELLLPTGARAVGMGQAGVAAATGAAAVWWNPALMARADKRELAYLFAQSLYIQGDNAISALLPIHGVGAAALTLRDIDYGEQEATDVLGPTGLLSPRTLVAIASFGAPMGPVNFGLSFKFFRQTFLCSGECPTAPSRSPSTSAIDLGVSSARDVRGHHVVLGASLVNLGRALQVIDAPQADPLPTRLQAGASVEPRLAALPKDVSLRLSTDVVVRLNGVGSPGIRSGAEVDWSARYQLRAGYALNAASGSGLAVGIGVRPGRFAIDLARFMSDITASSGNPPTYLTLRYSF